MRRENWKATSENKRKYVYHAIREPWNCSHCISVTKNFVAFLIVSIFQKFFSRETKSVFALKCANKASSIGLFIRRSLSRNCGTNFLRILLVDAYALPISGKDAPSVFVALFSRTLKTFFSQASYLKQVTIFRTHSFHFSAQHAVFFLCRQRFFYYLIPSGMLSLIYCCLVWVRVFSALLSFWPENACYLFRVPQCEKRPNNVRTFFVLLFFIYFSACSPQLYTTVTKKQRPDSVDA